MTVKRQADPGDLEFWGGAKARTDDATERQRQLACARPEDVFVDCFPTEADVSDFVWFECDGILCHDEEEWENSKVSRCPKPSRVVTC